MVAVYMLWWSAPAPVNFVALMDIYFSTLFPPIYVLSVSVFSVARFAHVFLHCTRFSIVEKNMDSERCAKCRMGYGYIPLVQRVLCCYPSHHHISVSADLATFQKFVFVHDLAQQLGISADRIIVKKVYAISHSSVAKRVDFGLCLLQNFPILLTTHNYCHLFVFIPLHLPELIIFNPRSSVRTLL